METIILSALELLFTFENLLFINIGMFIGILFGAIPGMNGNLAITVLLPFTFTLDPVPALLMLTAIFFGANFGGSISAILINTPGTNAAAATLIDGYPMNSIKGKPRTALDTALVSSAFGGIVSAICLLFFVPQISKVAMNFGAPEYLILSIFGLSIIASVSGKSLVKGLMSGCIGVLISTVGVDKISGTTRFLFGNSMLYNGLQLMAIILGVYAICQLIMRVAPHGDSATASDLGKQAADDRLTKKDIKNIFPTMVKSSFIGAFIGAMPGTGGAIASFVAYNEAKRKAKPGEDFGSGEIKGIAAPEAANNGATAAALIPLLTLGIPGDAVAATLLGAFTMQGLVAGPRLLTENGPVMYAILIGCLVSQIFILIQGKYLMPLFVKITHVPQDLLTAILFAMCATGAYAIANSIINVYVMLVSGVVAYLMTKVDFPPVPIVIGVVLGPLFESNLRNTLTLSKGSWSIFITRPISVVLLILATILIVIVQRSSKKIEKEEAEIIAKNKR